MSYVFQHCVSYMFQHCVSYVFQHCVSYVFQHCVSYVFQHCVSYVFIALACTNALTNADEGYSLLLHNHEGGVDVLNLLHTQSWVLVGPDGRGKDREGRKGRKGRKRGGSREGRKGRKRGGSREMVVHLSLVLRIYQIM